MPKGRLGGTALVAVALSVCAVPIASRGRSPSPDPPPRSHALYSRQSVANARRFAGRRLGEVSFAVLDNRRQLTGLHTRSLYSSASVSKAMLLIAYIRRIGARRLSSGEADQLRAMITMSDNDSASAIYAIVGGDGMLQVARAARMKRFHDVGFWGNAQISAGDQVRLFLRIDHLVRRAHGPFVRKLLRSIVSYQRWGIAQAVRGHRGVRIYFKGGWRESITHQIALVEAKGKRRVAIAVLTSGSPQAYAEQTIEGIARRVLVY